MKKPKMGAAITLFLVMGIIFPACFLWAVTQGIFFEDEYAERGRPVTVTVVRVVRVGSTSDVTVKYKDEDGQWIEASCTANQNVMAGQTLEGYVLPENPYQVYCKPDMALKILLYALIGGVAVGGWAILIGVLRDRSKYNKLIKNGIQMRARLTSWHNERGMIDAQFQIFRSNGQEQIINITAMKGTPVVGEYYNIVCAEQPNGSIVAALNDDRLR